jgi:hypothetical protein
MNLKVEAFENHWPKQQKVGHENWSTVCYESMSGLLITVAIELMKCNLDLVEMWDARWDRDGTESADDYTFLSRNGIVRGLW